LDPAGRVASWNAGAEAIKGYAAEEILGQHFSVFYTPEDMASGKPQQHLDAAAREGRVEDEGWRVRKDGNRFWADAIITAIRDPAGTLIAYGKVTRDLTMRRRIEEQLAQSNSELERFSYSVSHDLRRSAGVEGMDVIVDPLPPTRGDRTLLRQVLVNLIGNAFKFTRGRPHPQVEVGARREGPAVVYFVRDNGVGFDMRYADKLFGVFQRLHRADEFEGTGVGLALTQRIVQRHGGRIWADGKVDGGATFFFTLPVERPVVS